ncbi:MAG: SMP-30/gluconolactonase/LRE family protein [Armatimonadota bacterium]|nr:SMP-30/gluconolactonase/LRE family protein [bacterium]
MVNAKADLLVDVACQIGEAPLWHPDDNLLYWVDIPRGRIYTYNPISESCSLAYEGKPISGFTIQTDGSLLLFMHAGEIALWKSGAISTLLDSVPGSQDTIFNDTIADPAGRVFVGMKAGNHHKGQLYRLDTDCSLHLLLDDLEEPNGMGFTPDRKGMYFTDTLAHSIYLFNYDRTTGSISNQSVFVRVPDEDGIPDGLTVDAEGCVWSAHWDGGCVVRYSPGGREIGRIGLPVTKVSSITFGGADYSQLYISTSGGDNREREGELAGSLFGSKTQVKGVPEFRSRVTPNETRTCSIS